MSAKSHTSSFYGRPLQNPFAGVLFCKFCGHAIVRRPYPGNQPAHYICNRSGCPCRSTSDIEFHEVFIAALKDQLQSVNAMVVSGTDFDNDTDGLRDKLSRELAKLKKQQDSLCDLLEQGIYTPQIFTERFAKISERIKSISDTLNELPTRPQKSPREIAVALEQVVDIFMSESDATAKNALLKKIVRRIEYSKTTGGRWEKSDMAIEIFLNV
ncbi:MAG: zinc ribbon domain-containing protein, partial [Ruminococcus sp.]|nr:zinc ribbon domain-containing protein [Ruminococcus sp.]